MAASESPITTASVSIDLSPLSALKTRFKKLDVDRTGRIVALGNNKVLLVHDLEQPDKRNDFLVGYNQEQLGLNAVRWNPHHHRRMHLASAKGLKVIVWHLDETASPSGDTALRMHTSEVLDICWSQFEENMLVSAGQSIFSWDTRVKNSVQELKVPGMLTTQVSFNRKNAYLLASAFQNQVCIWDLRKAQKPALTIPAHRDKVTSLDWSHQSEYGLLTSGGGSIKLWSVEAAKAKQEPSEVESTSADRGTKATLQDRCIWNQPMQKILFAPISQAVITSSRGFFEGKREPQTIKMRSLAPGQRFQIVNTFRAGMARILGVSWRPTGDGGYQVASLDDADYLRLHDIKEPKNGRRPGLPAGESPSWRDYGSTAGSESVDGAASHKVPSGLRADLVPVVWSFSKLQRGGIPKMTDDIIRTAGFSPLREIMQVEKVAKGGGFGPVASVHVNPSENCVTLVMISNAEAYRPISGNIAQQLGSLDVRHPETSTTDPTDARGLDGAKFVATARLRVSAKFTSGSLSKNELATIQLVSDGESPRPSSRDPNEILCEDPLDKAEIEQMQAAAEAVLAQAPRSRQPQLEACLLKLRGDLMERVRCIANKAAGVVLGDHFVHQPSALQLQLDGEARVVPPDYFAQGNAGEKLLSVDLTPEPIVPCPRRFGATFAPNGFLVVFSSALAVVRARVGVSAGDNSGGKTPKEASLVYPRTYASLLDCLKNTEEADEQDKEVEGDDDLHPSNFDDPMRPDEHRSWVRSSAGYGPGHDWEERDDATSDGNLDGFDGYTDPEEAFVEKGHEALESRGQGDSTRLPISHPDHTLGEDLFTNRRSESDTVEESKDEDAAVLTEPTLTAGRMLPWKPKPKQVVLVDLSRFLPGSPYLSTFYKLGPWRPPTELRTTRVPKPTPASESGRNVVEESLFTPPAVDVKADSGASPDVSVSSSSRARRNSLVRGSSFGIVSGIRPPPPLVSLQRGCSTTHESTGRGGRLSRRSSVDEEQALPPTLHTQKKWESSPDFKLARGGGGNPRGGWGTPRGSGPRSGMGSPSYAGGSPGRWDLAKAIQPFLGLKSTGAEEVAVGSPFQQPQGSEVSGIAESRLREPRANVTPSRPHALTEDGLVFPTGGGSGPVGSRGAGTLLSPGAALVRKSSAQSRMSHWTPRKRPPKIRQNHPLPKSPINSPSGESSPPLDTPWLRFIAHTPTSSADIAGPASTSPPMSDFGMELGQSTPVSFLSAAPPAAGSRSSSFSAGTSVGFEEQHGGGEGAQAGHLGPNSGRVHASSYFGGDHVSPEREGLSSAPIASGKLAHTSHYVHPSSSTIFGNRSRPRAELWHGDSAASTADEEGSEEFKENYASVGHLSRHNAAVAAATGCEMLTSVWAIIADVGDKRVAESEDGTAGESPGVRWNSTGKSTGPHATALMFRQFETAGDPQLLASIACVLCSASRDGGCGPLLPQGGDKMTNYNRYLACYADQLYQWGGQAISAEIFSRQTGALRHFWDKEATGNNSRDREVSPLSSRHNKRGESLRCSICRQLIAKGLKRVCPICGHGGHPRCIQKSFRSESTECAIFGCTCPCMSAGERLEEAD